MGQCTVLIKKNILNLVLPQISFCIDVLLTPQLCSTKSIHVSPSLDLTLSLSLSLSFLPLYFFFPVISLSLSLPLSLYSFSNVNPDQRSLPGNLAIIGFIVKNRVSKQKKISAAKERFRYQRKLLAVKENY